MRGEEEGRERGRREGGDRDFYLPALIISFLEVMMCAIPRACRSSWVRVETYSFLCWSCDCGVWKVRNGGKTQEREEKTLFSLDLRCIQIPSRGKLALPSRSCDILVAP